MDKFCCELVKNKDWFINIGFLYKFDYVQIQGFVDKQGIWCIFVIIVNICSVIFIEIRIWDILVVKEVILNGICVFYRNVFCCILQFCVIYICLLVKLVNVMIKYIFKNIFFRIKIVNILIVNLMKNKYWFNFFQEI